VRPQRCDGVCDGLWKNGCLEEIGYCKLWPLMGLTMAGMCWALGLCLFCFGMDLGQISMCMYVEYYVINGMG
jgi:hypothetical protein